jgi:GNAT superfamily N-acetyltransferase
MDKIGKEVKREVRPLTPSAWEDFETLFGANGAFDGCWCMYWQVRRGEFDRGKGGKNRDAMQARVGSGSVPGVLLYVDGVPAGWCAVAKRSCLAGLADSRTLAPVDDKDVWSVSCFFIDRRFRGRGLSDVLLQGALAHVRRNGGGLVEAYPLDKGKRVADSAAWHGLASTFVKNGFKEVSRRAEGRPILRKRVQSLKAT